MSLDPRLQRRVQRYGWDLAPAAYEPLWQPQLACAQDELMACVAPAPVNVPLTWLRVPGEFVIVTAPASKPG